jgi:hypothetical protein
MQNATFICLLHVIMLCTKNTMTNRAPLSATSCQGHHWGDWLTDDAWTRAWSGLAEVKTFKCFATRVFFFLYDRLRKCAKDGKSERSFDVTCAESVRTNSRYFFVIPLDVCTEMVCTERTYVALHTHMPILVFMTHAGLIRPFLAHWSNWVKIKGDPFGEKKEDPPPFCPKPYKVKQSPKKTSRCPSKSDSKAFGWLLCIRPKAKKIRKITLKAC